MGLWGRRPWGRAAVVVGLIFIHLTFGKLHAIDFEEQLEFLLERAESDLLYATSFPEAAPGSVVAAPSRNAPDYFYFWIRDGAHAAYEVILLYRDVANFAKKRFLERIIWDYVSLSRQIQLTPNRSGPADAEGLGEPKWNLDQTPFNGEWGRPQDDGPALRARALAEFVRILTSQGRMEDAKRVYNGDRGGPLKVDLEFVARFHSRPNFEMWEEVLGHHLSTFIQHHRALVVGAEVARALGDPFAADHYEQEAARIQERISMHWDPTRGHLVQTLNRTGGLAYKESGLDSGVILAALDYHPRDPLPPWDERMLLTALKLKLKMLELHAINQTDVDHFGRPMMPGIGRYPEDRYDGVVGNQGGNPWFLITAAFAELSYELVTHWLDEQSITLTPAVIEFIQKWTFKSATLPTLREGETLPASDEGFWQIVKEILRAGDGYLTRYLHHADVNATPHEQFESTGGYQRGAERLTWNCAAVLGALRTRQAAMTEMPQGKQGLQLTPAP